jgi:hypothetical protein
MTGLQSNPWLDQHTQLHGLHLLVSCRRPGGHFLTCKLWRGAPRNPYRPSDRHSKILHCAVDGQCPTIGTFAEIGQLHPLTASKQAGEGIDQEKHGLLTYLWHVQMPLHQVNLAPPFRILCTIRMWGLQQCSMLWSSSTCSALRLRSNSDSGHLRLRSSAAPAMWHSWCLNRHLERSTPEIPLSEHRSRWDLGGKKK